MRDYFEAEMRLLREAAHEFADAFPEQAGMLNLTSFHDRDPYIERLLEGTAYLTGQVRAYIDHQSSDLAEGLLSHYCPQMLRPFPATTIVQFHSNKGQMQKTHVLPKGTALTSNPVGDQNKQTVCRVRTTSTVKVNPLHITQCLHEKPQAGGSLFRLTFQCDSNVFCRSLDLSDLCLYLHNDPTIALKLHHALTSKVKCIFVSFPEHPATENIKLNGQACIEPGHLSPAHTLLPTTGRHFHGFHLLHDYFSCRNKYLFVTLLGLDALNWPEQCRTFELNIQTAFSFQEEIHFDKHTFKLYCTPAVNLFSQESEPIILSHKRVEYPVIPDAKHRDSAVLYSVDSVTGLDHSTGKRTIYHAMHSFQHRKDNGRYYHVSHRKNGGKYSTAYLSVGGLLELSKESLSCQITASNGSYPRLFLKDNGVMHADANCPECMTCRNITRPTTEGFPPCRDEYLYSLVAYLSLNYHSLCTLEDLQKLLHNHDWTNRAENRRRVQGIRHLSVKSTPLVLRGVLLHCLEYQCIIEEDHFLSLSDIHLFGIVFHKFLSMYATINYAVRLCILCHPSNKEFTWAPQFGTNFPM